MLALVGKEFDFFYHGDSVMIVKIIGLINETGYFETEVNDGIDVWKSNASYGEVVNNIKKGYYVER